MGFWKTSGVDITPEVELTNWSICEVSSALWSERTRHFIGHSLTEGPGRVSSAIQHFDQDYMVGITRSGRSYKLSGNPGRDSDAQYVFGIWCARNQISEITDVTNEYLIYPEEKV